MNYWLLTSEYPPFFGGGISTYCYHTAKMLYKHGHNVSVFVNDNTVKDKQIETREGIRIIRFNPSLTNSASHLGHTTNISYEFAYIVKQFIEQEGKPDIIEAQEYLGIAYYLLQFKHLQYEWCNDIPVLITMHSPSFLYMEYNHVSEYRYPNYWICEMERFCLQASDYIISPSQYMIDELQKRFCLSHNRVAVVPNPYQIKARHTYSGSETEIVFYGKLTVQKGALKLLQYFDELWTNGFAENLCLIGGQDIVYHPEGVTMGELIRKKYATHIKNGKLRFEDRIEPGKIAERIAKVKLAIVPSNNDNLPYVVAEMMGMGKLVLVSEQGGHREVVRDGIDGFIFDHNQKGSFSKKLKQILQLHKTDLQRISDNAVMRIDEYFSHEKIYLQKKKVIDLVCSNSNFAPSAFPFTRKLTNIESAKAYTKTEYKTLSVVIPYYNAGKFLPDTINSILNSSHPLHEILIINDGSTEQTSIDTLIKYKSDSRIKVINTGNMGVGAARNKGAEEATGDYIAFLDADDLVDPDYYSKAIRVLSVYQNVHFTGCWTKYFEGSSKVWPTFNPEPPLLLYHNQINSSSIVVKRESFLQGGKNDPDMPFKGWEDYFSIISMINHNMNGVILPEKLFHYRVRRNSMIRSMTTKKKQLLVQYIISKYPELYAKYAADLLNLNTANGAGINYDNPTLDYHLTDRIPFGGKLALGAIQLVKKNRHIKQVAYKIYKTIKK
jgi:glycosyltransferase involved in cell wall biosynthesis